MRHKNLWIALGLVLVVFAVYGQVAGHEFLNYDDPVYVTANPQVQAGITWSGLKWAFTATRDANWFPLTWISHMLDCEFFGMNSGAQHLTNVALHALSTVLLFLLLRRMTGAVWRSAFVAFLFAMHPLHIESVAWVAERKDVLSGLFWILTLGAYARYAERESAGRYLAVVLLFGCGLLAKPMLVTLPFAMLLLDFWPLKRLGRRAVLEKLPLVALSIAASAVAYLVQQSGGTVAGLDQAALPLRIENALVSYAAYLLKLIWPANLAVFYPYPASVPFWQWLCAAITLAAITIAVVQQRRRPYLMVGWFWYLGTLVPVIGLVQIGSQARADRYTYLPMIGLAIMFAWGAAELLGKRAGVVGGIVCVACIGITWTDLGYWRDSITLFQHAIDVTGANYVAYNNLGVALRHEMRLTEAVADFETAVRIRPRDAEIQDNLGEALVADVKPGEAIPYLTEALRLQPDFSKARIDLGAAFMHGGDLERAAAQYRMVLQFEPGNTEANYGLGSILLEQGRTEEARPHLEQALPHLMEAVPLNPDDADAHYNLGRLLGIMGRADEAIAQFSQTVRLQPEDPEAHFNLGIALAARERWNEAAGEFSLATRLRPDYVNAHFNLGKVLAIQGRIDDAVREFSEALRLDPGFAPAQQALEALSAKR